VDLEARSECWVNGTVRGMGGMRKSLLTWPAVETMFLYDLVRANERASARRSATSIQGGDLCQYLDPILQGGEQGRMGLMHEEFGRWTHSDREP